MNCSQQDQENRCALKTHNLESMLSFLIDCHAPCDHIHIYLTYSFCDIQSHSKQLTTVKHEKH